MAAHIVVFFGASRSGKDTFAVGIRKTLERRNVHVITLSSIDRVKEFMEDCRRELRLPVQDNRSREARQAMADIKAALDKLYNWTVDLAIQTLMAEASDDKTVILYQVREIDNVDSMRRKCMELKIGFTAVFVYRPARSLAEQTADASSERYGPNDWQSADFVIMSKSLDILKSRSGSDIAATILEDLDKVEDVPTTDLHEQSS